MNNSTVYENLIAFHPGSYVEDIIEDLNITQKELAKRLGTTEKSLSKLINAEDRLSSEMALKLSKLSGVSYETWMNIQNSYDNKIYEIEEKRNENELRICNVIDFNYFKNQGIIKEGRYSAIEKIAILRKVLNISNLSYLQERNPQVSYRNTSRNFDERMTINSNVMLEIAMNQANDKCNKKYNKEVLDASLQEIRKLTTIEPQDSLCRLKEILFDCGIVFITLPNLKNAKINGAVKKFKNGTILLLVSDKNKYSDIFWFSLFHEIGHIINCDFYDTDYREDEYLEKERNADDFARDILIDPIRFKEYTESFQINKNTILSFAERENIHPGIVVGRLQYEKHLEYNQFNDLRVQYSFSKNDQL